MEAKDLALDKTMKEIGERLIELRKRKGYSSHETFAYDFNFSRVQYWRLERGKGNCTMKTLMRVLQIHNITLDEFFKIKTPMSS